MKKQILTLMVAAISITGFAQVGVGTENPQNALHIVGDGVRIENTAETSHYVLPAADGTAGQVLTTDGASAVTWAAVGGALSYTSTAATTYNVLVTDDIIEYTNASAGNFVLPAGVPVGKVFYFASTAGQISFAAIVTTSGVTLFGGYGGAVIHLGSGRYASLWGF
jgi:hypothetical protein